MMSGTHENFAPATRRRGPSDRGFGLVLAVAFLLPGLLAWHHGGPARFGYFAVGAFLLLIAVGRPSLLRLPNRMWTGAGVLLGKIVDPIVMALLFLFVIVPLAVVLRRMRKDLLNLSFDANAKTYWIPRDNASVSGMADQF